MAMSTHRVPDLPCPPALLPIPEAQSAVEGLWPMLTEKMRQFLIVRGQCGSDAEACDKADVAEKTPCQWKTNSEAFVAVYNLVLTAPLDFARGHLRALAPKASGVLDRAMEPGVPWKDAIRAAEVVIKANGMMAVKVDITERKLTYEEKLIRLMVDRGISVPEHIIDQLEE